MKFSKETKKNIFFVSGGSVFLCGILLLGSFIIGKFDLSVLLGSIIGTVVAILNFYLLAYSLQKAVDKPKSGKGIAGISYFLRNIFLLLFSIFAILVLKVNVISLVIPFIFPRIAILFLQITGKYQDDPPTTLKESNLK